MSRVALAVLGVFAVISVAFVGVGFAGNVDPIGEEAPAEPEHAEYVATATAPSVVPGAAASARVVPAAELPPELPGGDSEPVTLVLPPTALPKLPEHRPTAPAGSAGPVGAYGEARQFAEGVLKTFEDAVLRLEAARDMGEASPILMRMHKTLNGRTSRWSAFEERLTPQESAELERWGKPRAEALARRLTAVMTRLQGDRTLKQAIQQRATLNPAAQPDIIIE